MADIDLERRRRGGAGWVWWVVGLLIIGLIVWWAWPNNDVGDVAEVTAPVGAAAPAAETGAMGAPATTEPANVVSPNVQFGDITANPQEYMGRSLPTVEASVPEVPTDRGFWLEENGNRLFAIVIDQPNEQPVDINPGQRLRITGGTLRGPDYLGQVPGVPLDQDTRNIAQQQPIFLVVNESDIHIQQPGTP